MPYNINVVTENAGDLTAKYTVRPSPKRIELTPEQLQDLKEAPSVQDLQKKIRENDAKNAGATTKEQAADQIEHGTVNVDEIPF